MVKARCRMIKAYFFCLIATKKFKLAAMICYYYRFFSAQAFEILLNIVVSLPCTASLSSALTIDLLNIDH